VGRRLSRISSQSHSQQRAERQRAGSADAPAAGKRLHTFRDLADLGVLVPNILKVTLRKPRVFNGLQAGAPSITH
jgi:hypothetical protein